MESIKVADFTNVQPIGDWDAVYVPGDRSVVPMPTQDAPFPEYSEHTCFTNVFPSVQINLTRDCAWWMRLLPAGPTKTKVSMGM
jgi:hypothetical protein